MKTGTTQTGAERIAAAFTEHGRRAALMPYMMGGFPAAEHTLPIANACAQAGADLIEFGLPFSDPLADGPVIHAAATRALADGATPAALVDEIAPVAAELPVLAMTYYNIVEAQGTEAFLDRAAAARVSGLILPDLPFDEADVLLTQCEERGLALIQLVAPTTTGERMRAICERARGFVYAVSYTGTTGTGKAVNEQLESLIEQIRSHTELPVAVGFGIATPDDAARVGELADGVIVGSRLVAAAAEAFDAGREPAQEVGRIVAELSAALA